jgi:predicted nuclease with TOPRIM domain
MMAVEHSQEKEELLARIGEIETNYKDGLEKINELKKELHGGKA